MEFKNINYAYLLLIIPFLVSIYIWYWNWSKKKINSVFDKKIIPKINPYYKKSLKIFRLSLYLLSIVFIVIACMDPVTKGEPIEKEVNREGIDIFFALDISKSMLTEDVKPNRIKKSKQILSEVISSLKGDKVGVIVYAAGATVVSPLTLDYAWVKNQIKDVDTDMLSSQGTNLTSAIELSINSFNNEDKLKCLFIISDGEDHEDTYIDFIDQVNDKNIIIHTIFIGTERGGLIPITKGNKIEYKKDVNGKEVLSKGNISALEEIAKRSNGLNDKSNNNQEIVNFIINTINSMEKTILDKDVILVYEEKKQFPWFLGVAIFLILLDFTIKKNE